MPLLTITTNQTLEPSAEEALGAELSRRCAILLGKSETYVMVSLSGGKRLWFAGSSDPAIFAELRSIGLEASEAPRLSEALCELLANELKVPSERIYLNFPETPRDRWGWNGGTFAVQ